MSYDFKSNPHEASNEDLSEALGEMLAHQHDKNKWGPNKPAWAVLTEIKSRLEATYEAPTPWTVTVEFTVHAHGPEEANAYGNEAVEILVDKWGAAGAVMRVEPNS
jgi:hypothetical protein